MAEPVVVVDYDEAWPGIFEALRVRVARGLGDLAIAVEHVGSTAIPGLAAKPIVDIDVVIASRDALPAAIAALRRLGYAYRGDQGVPGREAFEAPAGVPPHHLFVCTADSPELQCHLVFRDYLRRHDDAARAYEALKRELSERYRDDREAYTDGKGGFVAKTLTDAEDEAPP
jgi:GrpB-like predicted nucleotidyltransferase (UPF0157 family)